MCMCVLWLWGCSECLYGGCEKVQDWSGKLTSNESGVLPSMRVNMGEREIHRDRDCVCVA